jgi:anti-sigma B factor antagonist
MFRRRVGGIVGTDTLSIPTEVVSLPIAVVATTAGEIRARLHDAVDAGTGPLLLDLGAVERLDVVGLGVLVGAHRRAPGRGRQLRVIRPSRRVAAVLHITGLDRVLSPHR